MGRSASNLSYKIKTIMWNYNNNLDGHWENAYVASIVGLRSKSAAADLSLSSQR